MDGIIRARQSENSVEPGQDVNNTFYQEIIQSGKPYGTYTVLNTIDGIVRTASYRVMPDYPLIISVEKSTQVVLAGYEQRKQSTIFGASLVSFFIIDPHAAGGTIKG